MAAIRSIYQGEAEVLILSSADIEGVQNEDLDNFTMSVALAQQVTTTFRRDCCDKKMRGYLEWENVSSESGVAVIDLTAEQSSKLPIGVYTLGIKFHVNDVANNGVVYREIKNYIEVKPSIFK